MGPRQGRRLRIDVFTIFPEVSRRVLLGRASSDERGATGSSSCVSTTFVQAPATPTAPWTMRRSGAERAWCSLRSRSSGPSSSPTRLARCTCSSPGGRRFDQSVAARARGSRVRTAGPAPGFSLLCGRYEGVDQRIADHLVDGELSIGDFVLAGGELAALVVVEATVRLVPGVLGNAASAGDESFTTGLLEYPQYTRPATFRGWEVPEVLRGGDHARVERWRRARSSEADARAPAGPDRGPRRSRPRRGAPACSSTAIL